MLGPNDAAQQTHVPAISPHSPLQALCAMYREGGRKAHTTQKTSLLKILEGK